MAKPEVPALMKRLQAHFGGDPSGLPVVEQAFAGYERANLHLALQEMLTEPRRRAELVGVIVLEEYRAANLARIVRPGSAASFDAGPVEYVDVPLPDDRHVDEALAELLVMGGALTQSLLGAGRGGRIVRNDCLAGPTRMTENPCPEEEVGHEVCGAAIGGGLEGGTAAGERG